MTPLRLGLVGCGDIARYVAFIARFDPRIRAVACCDRMLEGAERFATKHRVPRAYGDVGEMFAEERLDAVYLAVPHDLHLPFVRAGIDAGVHVLVEKPIARTLDEGLAIVCRAWAADVCVGVNYQYRYDRAAYALAMAARQGDLGRIFYARCSTPWHRDEDYFERSPWHRSLERSGGGTLLTQGSHALDVALWALDSAPTAVTGMTGQMRFDDVEVEDLALGSVELESGALVQVASSMVATPERGVTVEIYGEKGTGVYHSGPVPHVRFHGVRVQKLRPPIWGLHALQRSLAAFAAWVTEGVPYLTPAEEALPVLAAIDGIYRAARSGRRERIEIRELRVFEAVRKPKCPSSPRQGSHAKTRQSSGVD